MVTTYCGNLVAFLTFPTLETKIDSIAELVERGDSIKVGLRSGTYLEDYMREAPTGSKYKVFH
jgi:glutamate receptor, ionotropic, invertebrate